MSTKISIMCCSAHTLQIDLRVFFGTEKNFRDMYIKDPRLPHGGLGFVLS